MKKIKYILPMLALIVLLIGCPDPDLNTKPDPVTNPVTGAEVTYNGLEVQNGGVLYVEMDNQTTTINIKLQPEGVIGRVTWEKGAGFDGYAELNPATGYSLSAAVLGKGEGNTSILLRAFNNYNGDKPITFQIQVAVVEPGKLPVLAFNVLNGGAAVANDSVVTLFTDNTIDLTAQLLPASIAAGENVTWTFTENAFADITRSSDNLSLIMTGKTKGSFNVRAEAGNDFNTSKLTRSFTVNVMEPPPSPDVWIERPWTQYAGTLTSVAYGNGVFVAAGAVEGRSIWALEDMAWNAVTHNKPAVNRMIFTNGRFISISNVNAAPDPAASVSTDGKTWTASNDNLGAAHGISADGDRRIIIGGWSGQARASINNGVSWNTTNLFSNAELPIHRSATVRGFAYGEGTRVVGIGLTWDGTTPHGIIVYNDLSGIGQWSTAYTTTAGTLNAIVYAQGRYVAVGINGVMVHSTDGINWENVTNKGGLTDSINTIVYDNGQFVAGAHGGRIAYSLDGVNWTAARTVPNFNIMSITYGGDKWVAVGANGRIAYSGGADSVKYPVAVLNVTNNTRQPPVIVTEESSFTMGDNREITMSAAVDPSGHPGQIIEWSASGPANIQVIPENNGANVTLKGTPGSSGNGNTITVTARNHANVTPVVLTFNIDVYDHTSPRPITGLTVRSGAGSINNGVLTLADEGTENLYLRTATLTLEFEPEDVEVTNITWSTGNGGITVEPSSNGKSATITGVTIGAELPVTVTATNSAMGAAPISAEFTVQVVKPPLAWRNAVIPSNVFGDGGTIWGIAHGKDIWVAGGTTGAPNQGVLAYSENGRIWNKATIDFGTLNDANNTVIRSVGFADGIGGGTFFAGGSSGQIYSSVDGKNWTRLPAINSYTLITLAIKYANNRLVIAGNSFNRIMFSTNATPTSATWALSPAETSGTIFDITYGNGRWVAVEQVVAVGGGGVQPGLIRYSDNLASWTAVGSVPPPQNAFTGLYGVAYGNGVFVTVGDNNRVFYSPDGITWTAASNPGGGGNAITYGNGYFVAADNSNIVRVSRDGTSWVTANRTGIGGTASTHLRSVSYSNGLWLIGGASGSLTWATEDETDLTRYFVDFNSNTTDAVTGMPSLISNITGTISLPDETPIRDGFRFTGWFREPACINQWNFNDPVTNDMILYARWSLIYTVTFEANGDNVTDMPANLTGNTAVISGGRIDQPIAPSRVGYRFLGWFREPSAITPWDFIFDTVTGNTTLYAGWVAVWTVTFNANGDDVTNLPAVISNANHGQAIERPAVNPIRNGYSFINWFKEPACINLWNFATDLITSNTNLYAGWIKNENGQGWTEITVFWLNEENTFAGISSDTTTLSRRASDSVTITVEGVNGYPVLFMVNGVIVPSAGNSYTFSAATKVNGLYELEAVVEKDGKYYSAGFRVRVIN